MNEINNIARIPKGKKIILFDGFCNLCDASVQLIIKRDSKDIFRFVSLQSEFGEFIINHIGVNRFKTDSIILFEPNKGYYCKSQAAINIAKHLGGLYPLLSLFKCIPTFILDIVYDFIAKHRYKWYGKKSHCLIPSNEILQKFI